MDDSDETDVTVLTPDTESTVGTDRTIDRERTGETGGLERLRELFASRGESMSRADAERAVERSRRVSGLLDEAFTIPGLGYRVGLDPVVGILPVAGDSVAAAASLYIVVEAFRAGAPVRTLATMLFLVGVDFALGSVPVLGTLIDAVLKVNKRNASMLESHVESSFD
ncbi:DUF4112 domain-containing protein [Halorubrum sp. CSM-61]|uniref:DUF4112 domain-containing protein n=1 Tax=Halorubrum sp. CSM-61 TaxID=2485838 RepID=UPI001F14DCA7|nr:DUF4112 domain-containing protein [Halorubrum sp. CSM-61]